VNGDERAYALSLDRQVTPAETTRRQTGTAEQWAGQSHDIAVELIYGKLPHTGTLSDSYENAALPVVNEQLEEAGIRLAVVLNHVLARQAY
jgi:hypothetical protein